MVTLRLAVAVGVVVAVPVALYHLWAFISPILVPSERKAILPAVYMTAGSPSVRWAQGWAR